MSEEVFITTSVDGNTLIVQTVMATDDICVCGVAKKALVSDRLGTVHILCLECNHPAALPKRGGQMTLDGWIDNEESEGGEE